MNELRYTLTSDGSSDRALIPILDWALRQHGVSCAIQGTWADLRPVRRVTGLDLVTRIVLSAQLYPCDLLFVHRDSERMTREARVEEIEFAVRKAITTIPPAVCVVPVRMQEAWLLLDETAIRHAAGNLHGTMPLMLPRPHRVEDLPDPKDVLHAALRGASGLEGRRRRQFQPEFCAWRVAEYMSDYACLRQLSAFTAFEDELATVVCEKGWSHV